MSFRLKNLLYVVQPEFIAQLSDLQDELLESLSSIVDGFEGLKDVIDSLDIPSEEEIYGDYSPAIPAPQIIDPF